MTQSISWKKSTALISAAALMAGGGAAFAATGETAKSTSQYSAASAADRADHEAMRTLHDQELAKALGIDVAKLQAAQKTARQQVLLKGLDEQVKAGRLTQAQADELRAAAANGTLDAALKKQARARLVEHLAADVKSGRITQAQSDARLKAFDAQPAGSLDGPGFGRGPGGHGGFGGPGGQGRGGPRAGLNG